MPFEGTVRITSDFKVVRLMLLDLVDRCVYYTLKYPVFKIFEMY